MDTGHAPSGTASAAVSARLQAWIDEHERSIPWVAGKIGIGYEALWRRLRGKTGWLVDELPAVAAFIGVTLDELMTPIPAEPVEAPADAEAIAS